MLTTSGATTGVARIAYVVDERVVDFALAACGGRTATAFTTG
jgi:hypothetical protein